MWPFSSSSTRSTDDLEKELPENLKVVFQKENPEHRQDESIEKNTKEQILVNRMIQKAQEEHKNYNFEFDQYKKNENIAKVSSINCAELQQNVLLCLKSWKATDYTFCAKEIKSHSNCLEVQTEALRKLQYDNCVDLKHCKQIRFIVDELFVKNFGSLGEKFDEDNYITFMREVEGNFENLWSS
ncbi:hypothetical protein CLIB1423_06S03972 [[Candida] railenensis]|uniref:Uncharacterized protein n=1 Tax=[Candida] railenensis TaxID=45579 RepID=A0A9P0QPJ3_9ASCO|nr:hypothetical protein CLIB1423_06S03972 [[Candida] railenensis]